MRTIDAGSSQPSESDCRESGGFPVVEDLPLNADATDGRKTNEEFEAFWAHLAEESETVRGNHDQRTELYAENDISASPSKAEIGSDAKSDTEGEIPAEPSFEQRYQTLLDVINNKPSHSEILRRILAFCRERKDFTEVEDKVQTYPEYSNAGQNPFRLITYLLDGDGLDLLELDEAGNELTDEQKTGLTEDEIDDLIDTYALETTEVGRAVADDLAPERRLDQIFGFFSDRRPLFTELLEFCRQPRSFKEIEKLFAGRDFSAIKTLHPESGLAVKPTVFVDNMEKSGGLVWKDGWIITKEGEEYLKAFLEKTVS